MASRRRQFGELEDWLETIRRLPTGDVIYAREGALENRIAELRRPKPKGQASPFAFVLRAKQATEKRRRQLQRFVALRDGLAAEEAPKLTIAGANATIEITGRLLKMAGGTEYKLFCEYSASQDAPGHVPSPDAADAASVDAARRHGRDPEAAAGVSGVITQLLMLSIAAQSANSSAAYAAVLEQARLVHEDFTGNKGLTLELVLLAQGHDVVGGGGVAPHMAWVLGSAGLNLAGTTMPPTGAAAPAPAAGPSTRGPPVFHAGYAGVVSGGHAPNPDESVGH